GTRTISGTIAGNLIDFNGADNVTINGSGTLTIDNTSTNAAAATIRFINDAKNNTVQNCIIKGSGTGTTVGTIFFSTGSSTGNDTNTIDSNNIVPSSSSPINAIYSSTATADNSGIVINNNNISDYFSAASVSSDINLSA